MTALVTGASGGLGRAIAEALAPDHDIVVHYRSDRAGADKTAETVTACGAEARLVELDLAIGEADALDTAAETLITDTFEQGENGVVVLNAAHQDVVEWDQLTTADVDRIWSVGLRANTALMVAAGRRLGPGSCVVTVGSIEGFRPALGHSIYATGKAALHQLTAAAALELGGRGIRVVGVAPGLIDRDGLAEQWPEGVQRWTAATPLRRVVTAHEVASVVAFLASPLASAVTGVVVPVDAGWSASPGW